MSMNAYPLPSNLLPLPHPFLVKEATAAQSLDKQGKIIRAGEKKTRLRIGNDSRYWVAAKSSEEMQGLTAWKKACLMAVEVRLNNGSSAMLNVNSLAKRLHIKKRMIKDLAERGELISSLDKIVQQVSRAVITHEQISQFDRKISKKNLMRITRTAADISFSLKPEEGKVINVKKKHYIVRLSKKRCLKIYEIGERIGRGSFGDIKLACALHKNQVKCLKVARTDIDIDMECRTKAILTIENEYRILCRIHENGKVMGIQEKPKAMISMTLDGQSFVGYLGKKYDHDYFDDVPTDDLIDSRLIEFYQILSGLKYLEELEILHGDIKRENLFVENVNGKKLVCLADFGDARDSAQSQSAGHAMPGTMTRECSSPRDHKYAKAFVDQNEKLKLIQLVKKMDVFATGIAFYESLTGKPPFKEDEENPNFPLLSSYDAESLKQTGVPEEIQELIKKMLVSNYHKRMTATKAFKMLEAFFIEKKPSLLQSLA